MRPDRTPSHAELQQQERTGITCQWAPKFPQKWALKIP